MIWPEDGRALGSVASWCFLSRLAQQRVPDPDAGQIGGVGGRFEPVVLRYLPPVVLVAGRAAGQSLQVLVGQEGVVDAALFGSAAGRREFRGELVDFAEQVQARAGLVLVEVLVGDVLGADIDDYSGTAIAI